MVSTVATSPSLVGGGLDGCGAALLEDQLWTLQDKAQRMEAIQSRHDRHGLVADCSLTSFGDTATCTNHDTDNNGLWTSLVVAAEVLRYVATNDSEAAAAAWHYYDGMKLLNRITGIKVVLRGLLSFVNTARSMCGLRCRAAGTDRSLCRRPQRDSQWRREVDAQHRPRVCRVDVEGRRVER
jgi:hypothetical protein